MADTILTIKEATGIIAEAAAGMFAENLKFCKSIDKLPEKEFEGKNGYKAGDTVYINKPTRFVEYTGGFDITSQIQDMKEEKVALALDITSNVSFDFDSIEMATKIGVEGIIKRCIEPAANAMAAGIEQRMLQKATQATYNSVGTAGSNAFLNSDVLAAKVKMDQFMAPKDNNRFLLMNSASGALAVTGRSSLFNDQTALAKQYADGMIGRADGFNWMENELLYNHTNGNDVVFEVRTTVATEGQATLVVEALTATTGTVTKGTSFTIAGVYAVHPVTFATLPNLQQFTVTALATADGSGYATLSVSPAFYTSASTSLQNISAFPVDGAAIVPVGAASTAYTQNLAFHKSAFRMASVPLIMPTNAEMAEQRTVDGFTIAVVRDFDVLKRKFVTRLDFLGGLVADRPEWACRLTS